MKLKQRGVSIFGMLIVAIVVSFVGLIAAQVVPTLVEYQAILKAAKKVAAEGGTVPEMRASFDKAQNIDDFKAISGKDLEITKNGDKVVVSFSYNKEIPLAGPAYLLMKYAGTTSK